MRIILFLGIHETMNYFTMEWKRTFERDFEEVFLYDTRDSIGSQKRLKAFYGPGETVAVSFNFTGCIWEGENLLEALHIPVVNLLLDHPMYFYRELSRVPSTYYHMSVDRNHETYMRTYYPNIPNLGFCPLGGNEGEGERNQERTIPVLFTGNYPSLEKYKEWLKKLGPSYEIFFENMFADIDRDPSQTVEEVVKRHLERENGEVSLEEMKESMHNCIYVDQYARYKGREKALRVVAESGVELHICGIGWEQCDFAKRENVQLHGLVDSQTCLDYTRKAKILLNVMPWFKDGAHDRVFTGMLQGAAVITDESKYLLEECQNAEVTFYRLGQEEQLPVLIEELLNEKERWQEQTKRAKVFAKERHTWEKRALYLEEKLVKECV